MPKRYLYKYLTSAEHAHAMMRGEILFRPLSYFQGYEDDAARGDKGEGRVASPAIGEKLVPGQPFMKEPFDLPGREFAPRVKASDDVFVCCLSRGRSSDLAKKFGANVIVVIKDPKRLLDRIRRALPPWAELPEWEGREGDGWRIAKPVIYDTSALGVVHAFPAEIATRKDPMYSWQQEYRILFGRKNALVCGNVNYQIEPKGYREIGQPAESRQEEPIVVQTKPLEDIAEIIAEGVACPARHPSLQRAILYQDGRPLSYSPG